MNERNALLSGRAKAPLRFYALDQEAFGSGHFDFGLHLRKHVTEFRKVLEEMKIEVPVDELITQGKMERRIEASCLLFKSCERILQALHDLRELGRLVNIIEPRIESFSPFKRTVLELFFDLDHVFLLEYKIKKGRVVELTGFHVDYRGDIAQLGLNDPLRLIVEKNDILLKGIERVVIELYGKRSTVKTLFPSHWGWLECLNSALEAIRDVRIIQKNEKNILKVIGLCKQKIAIQLIIDGVSGKVKTFFPDIEMTGKYLQGG